MGRNDDDCLTLCVNPTTLRKNRDVTVLRSLMCTFWLSTIGILVYVVSMWIAGVMQGLMWRAFNTLPDDGTLKYTFIESIAATKPYYAFRLLGGILFLTGMFIMAYNVYKTVYKKQAANALIPQATGA